MSSNEPLLPRLQRGVSDSAQATQRLGQRLASHVVPGMVISLDGTLGAGKTCLAKGLVAELAGVSPDEVTSPAYSLVKEYGNPLRVAHMDFYRFTELDGADAEVLEEYFLDRAVTVVVEWGAKFIQHFTRDYLQIVIDYGDDDDSRILDLIEHGRPRSGSLSLESLLS